jgi:hypothetical protein
MCINSKIILTTLISEIFSHWLHNLWFKKLTEYFPLSYLSSYLSKVKLPPWLGRATSSKHVQSVHPVTSWVNTWTNFSWQDKPWAEFSTLEVAPCHVMHLLHSIARWPNLELTTRPCRFSLVRNHAPQLILSKYVLLQLIFSFVNI